MHHEVAVVVAHSTRVYSISTNISYKSKVQKWNSHTVNCQARENNEHAHSILATVPCSTCLEVTRLHCHVYMKCEFGFIKFGELNHYSL